MNVRSGAGFLVFGAIGIGLEVFQPGQWVYAGIPILYAGIGFLVIGIIIMVIAMMNKG